MKMNVVDYKPRTGKDEYDLISISYVRSAWYEKMFPSLFDEYTTWFYGSGTVWFHADGSGRCGTDKEYWLSSAIAHLKYFKDKIPRHDNI